MAEQTINANKALWEKGDFTRIAEKMRGSGRELVAELGLGPGVRVLDVGCGDGTTAIPAAETGAEVLGVDISAPLVAAGSARAKAAGLANVHFQEGDASPPGSRRRRLRRGDQHLRRNVRAATE
jgi:cyclopropane fatty-acyl-phospholipid synthase-like methyltransferase